MGFVQWKDDSMSPHFQETGHCVCHKVFKLMLLIAIVAAIFVILFFLLRIRFFIIRISPNGSHVAYGTSEGGVGLLAASSLRCLWTLPNAHGFTVTALDFDPLSRFLVSASADYTCRVHDTRRQSSGT
jgi:WD40 repeat protein